MLIRIVLMAALMTNAVVFAEPVTQVSLTGSNQITIAVSQARGKRFNLQSRTTLAAKGPWINVDGSHADNGGTNFLLLSTHEGLSQIFRIRAEAPENNGSTLFDESRVATIKFTVAATNYPILTNITGGTGSVLNNDGEYVPAEMEFDGESVGTVGLRRKGNSSGVRTDRDNPNYIPFKVDFDRYVDGQKFKGLSKLNLHVASTASGGSGLEDYLGYGVHREYGNPSPRTGWAEVWLDGTVVGLYTTVEQVNGQFLKRWFDYGNGNLYKPESPAGTLEWRGETFASYTNANYERGDDTNHTAFLHFIDVINHAGVAGFADAMDVEGVLNYLAGDIAIGAWDSYTAMSHNYYLYEAPLGRMTMLPWDMNDSMSLGTNLWQSSGAAGGGGNFGNNGGNPFTNGLPGGGGGFPTNGIPGGGGAFPTNGIPGGGISTNLPGGGGGPTNSIPGGANNLPGGFGGGSHPLSEKLLSTNSPYGGLYLTVMKAYLTGPGSKEALNARIDAAELVLSNRLDGDRVLRLRTNIAARVDSLLSEISQAKAGSQ